jgi:hypothetical protein
MALLTTNELDVLEQELLRDTENRFKGSFTRALKFGGKRLSNIGMDKGIRKELRNAPKKLLKAGARAVPVIGPIAVEGMSAGAKELYRRKFKKTKVDPASKAKYIVKDLQGGDLIKTLDRNLLKMKKAQTEADKNLQTFQSDLWFDIDDNQKFKEFMKDSAKVTIRSIMEVQHYESKVIFMACEIAAYCEELNETLAKLQDNTKEIYDEFKRTLTK